MSDVLKIPENVLESSLEKAKGYISLERIHEYMSIIDEGNQTRFSGKVVIHNKDCRRTIKSLETLLGFFISVKDAYLSSDFTRKQEKGPNPDDSNKLVYLHSLRIGNQEAIAGMGFDEDEISICRKSVNGNRIRFDYANPSYMDHELESAIANCILSDFKKGVLDNDANKSNIAIKTLGFHLSLYSSIKEEINNDEENIKYAGKLKDIPIIIKGKENSKERVIVLNEIGENKKRLVDPYQLDPDYEKKLMFNVGNEEISYFLSNENKLLACYDVAGQRNPAFMRNGTRPRARVILLTGEPGTGKTELIEESNYELAALARTKGAKYNIQLLNNSFWDKYLGESTNKFRKILDGIADPGSINRLVLDDCESLIPKRDSDTSGEAGRRVLKEFFTFIDNTGRYNKGNFDIILSTNYKFLLDNALSSRVTHEKRVYGPQTTDEYREALFGRHLHGWNNNIVLSEKEEIEIASKCNEYKLSGRDLFAVSNETIDYIMNPESYDSKMIIKTGNELEREINMRFRDADSNFILGRIDERHKSKVYEHEQEFGGIKNERLMRMKAEYEAEYEFSRYLKNTGIGGRQNET